MKTIPIESDERWRRMDRPQEGFWLVRQVKGGPRVPAAIMVVHTTQEPGEPGNLMERSPFVAAFVAGEPVAVDVVWLHRGESITEADYNFRVADIEWAKEHAPDEPQAQPRRRIDLMQATLPF